jgi:uncharacterized lipoprotein YmbA
MKMRDMRRFEMGILLWTLLLVGVVGCATTEPARFYTLSPLSGAQAPAKPCVTLGLGPVSLPEYLDRPQIVTQTSANEMKLGDFDQWAEPLEKTFTRTLGENLSALLCVEEVIQYPGKSADGVDYQVTVNVGRFHGMADGTALLQAQWTVAKEGSEKTITKKQSNIRIPVEGSGFAALVAAQSRALEKLSTEIASEIRGAGK